MLTLEFLPLYNLSTLQPPRCAVKLWTLCYPLRSTVVKIKNFYPNAGNTTNSVNFVSR